MVGPGGFEPPTSAPPERRANQTALRPDAGEVVAKPPDQCKGIGEADQRGVSRSSSAMPRISFKARRKTCTCSRERVAAIGGAGGKGGAPRG